MPLVCASATYFFYCQYAVKVLTEREEQLAAFMPVKGKVDDTMFLASPMPGAVTQISVNVGDSVCCESGIEFCYLVKLIFLFSMYSHPRCRSTKGKCCALSRR